MCPARTFNLTREGKMKVWNVVRVILGIALVFAVCTSLALALRQQRNINKEVATILCEQGDRNVVLTREMNRLTDMTESVLDLVKTDRIEMRVARPGDTLLDTAGQPVTSQNEAVTFNSFADDELALKFGPEGPTAMIRTAGNARMFNVGAMDNVSIFIVHQVDEQMLIYSAVRTQHAQGAQSEDLPEQSPQLSSVNRGDPILHDGAPLVLNDEPVTFQGKEGAYAFIEYREKLGGARRSLYKQTTLPVELTGPGNSASVGEVRIGGYHLQLYEVSEQHARYQCLKED